MGSLSFDRIVTHNDFDGMASAALLLYIKPGAEILFSAPLKIQNNETSVRATDAVCDLPYPLRCAAWFDHHPGNLMELKLRKIDPLTVPGSFAPERSCARVVYNFLEPGGLPEYFSSLAAAADMIDSFAYEDVGDWRRPMPGKLIDRAVSAAEKGPGERNAFMRRMIHLMSRGSLADAAADPEVSALSGAYSLEEERMLKIIAGKISFLPEDAGEEMVILDFTGFSRKPDVRKHLALLKKPGAGAVLEVSCRHEAGVKTNNLLFSMCLGFPRKGPDLGGIMRALNMGDGHSGAAAGRLNCSSKKEMLARKASVLKAIFRHWRDSQR